MLHVSRRWIVLFAAGLLAGTFVRSEAASGQAQLPHIGILLNGSLPADAETLEPFVDELRALGYVDGKTIVIDVRESNGQENRYPFLIAELLRERPKAIVVSGSQAVRAAAAATATVPIVAVSISHPIAQGLAHDLRRPTRNVTGNALIPGVADEKTLELARDMLSRASHLGFLTNPGNPVTDESRRRFAATAAKMGIKLDLASASTPSEMRAAIDALAAKRVDGVVVSNDAKFYANRSLIIDRVAQLHLAAFYGNEDFVGDGGLASYSYDIAKLRRNAARFVDRILKGAKVSELPFEQPTSYRLVINRNTAKGLGLVLPSSVLQRAVVVE